MKIAIINYNSGNVQSVQYALQRIGAASEVTDDAATIQFGRTDPTIKKL